MTKKNYYYTHLLSGIEITEMVKHGSVAEAFEKAKEKGKSGVYVILRIILRVGRIGEARFQSVEWSTSRPGNLGIRLLENA